MKSNNIPCCVWSIGWKVFQLIYGYGSESKFAQSLKLTINLYNTYKNVADVTDSIDNAMGYIHEAALQEECPSCTEFDRLKNELRELNMCNDVLDNMFYEQAYLLYDLLATDIVIYNLWELEIQDVTPIDTIIPAEQELPKPELASETSERNKAKRSTPRIVKAKFNKTSNQIKIDDDKSVKSNKYEKRFKKTKKPPKL